MYKTEWSGGLVSLGYLECIIVLKFRGELLSVDLEISQTSLIQCCVCMSEYELIALRSS